MNEFKNMPYTFYLDNYKKRQWLVRVWKKGKSVWQWEERITRTELKKKIFVLSKGWNLQLELINTRRIIIIDCDVERERSLLPLSSIDAAKIQFNRRVANKAQDMYIYIYIRSSSSGSWIIPGITIVRVPALNYPYRQTGCFYSPSKVVPVRCTTALFPDIGRSIRSCSQENERLSATNDTFYSCFALLLFPPLSYFNF